MNEEKWFTENRLLWDTRARLHVESSFYNNGEFLRGKNSLNEIELKDLGDITGKKILHLQCHFGQDSISLSRMGAHVTGVDFSPKAIDIACAMAKELNQNTQFYCKNIYDLHPEAANNKNELESNSYDIVLASYGTICWLPSLKEWAEIISYYLKPGGFFLLVDTHPYVLVFDDSFHQVQYEYNSTEPIIMETSSTYTNQQLNEKLQEYSWNHSLSNILSSLLHAGLRIESFMEHMYSPYNCYQNMIESLPGKWQIKNLENKIPLLFSLKAIK